MPSIAPWTRPGRTYLTISSGFTILGCDEKSRTGSETVSSFQTVRGDGVEPPFIWLDFRDPNRERSGCLFRYYPADIVQLVVHAALRAGGEEGKRLRNCAQVKLGITAWQQIRNLHRHGFPFPQSYRRHHNVLNAATIGASGPNLKPIPHVVADVQNTEVK